MLLKHPFTSLGSQNILSLMQPIGFLILFVLEILVISLALDVRILREESCNQLFCWLSYSGDVVKVVMVAVIIFGIVINRGFFSYLNQLILSQTTSRRHWMITQIVIFVVFYFLSQEIFNNSDGDPSTALGYFWLGTGLICGLLFILAIAPAVFWTKLIFKEKIPILVSLFIGCFTYALTTLTADLWHPLSQATFFVSSFFLEFTGLEVVSVPEKRLLGVEDFIVNVASSCSGYEGIGLIIGFSSAYLYFFRGEFNFPRALLLFPIGITCIWIFNSIRIATLIYIGHIWSPEVAVGGFHSQAGWISFIVCALGILWLAHSSSFFAKEHSATDEPAEIESPALSAASLVPLLVLLGSNLVISALTAEFDYLYPIKAILLLITILYVWKQVAIFPFKFTLEPILAAFLVSTVWYLLVPVNLEYNSTFQASLDEMSDATLASWLAIRVLGAVILVPIAEELGFRGYLLCRLDRQMVNLNGPLHASLFAIIVSSVVFGLLHNGWVVGTIAGVVYAILRVRSGRIGPPILGHALTNAILCYIAWSQGMWHLL